MNRILVDTNVILDLLAEREPFYEASRMLFTNADKGEIHLVVSSLSLVNVHYILESSLKLKNAKEVLRKFKVLVENCELNKKIFELALNDSDFKDFEDGIQYYTAVEANCDIILSRNLKDFKNSQLPVMTPDAYINF